MKGCGYKRNVSVRRLVDHMLAARDFRKQASRLKRPDAIIASLPDHLTAAAAVEFGNSVGSATMIDVRDKWPDIFIDHAPTPLLKSLAGLALARESHRAAKALRNADGLVAMMQSMMDWGLAKAERPQGEEDRVFYLTTTPRNFGEDISRPELTKIIAAALEAVRGKTVFAFVGTFNRTQHPALLLDALDLLKERAQLNDNVAFLIGGGGVDEEKVWSRVNGFENVHGLGWLDTAMMNAVLARSDVGLLLMNFPSPAFNNKAFAYLASGLPIINGATGDLADLIDQEGIGVNVRGGDKEQLADAILRLGADTDQLAKLQARTRNLFNLRFDREANYEAYADYVEFMALKKQTAS